ncbi:MAG: M14 family metallocarboxypeptidase [Opitutales bacterium]|nr:M14 family metallocarboxypeptidase [Opitutales bacterium]
MTQDFSESGYFRPLRAAAEAAGFAWHEAGRFHGLPQVLLRRGHGESGEGPRVYVSAGIHGDEPAGSLAVLEGLRRGGFAAGVAWDIFPALNPGGLVRGTRENPGGIDLNRDYRALAAPETRCHVRWIECEASPYDLYISLHEDWEAQGFYLYEINTSGGPSMSAAILAAVAQVLPLEHGPEVDGHRLRGPGWIYHPPEPDEPEGWPEAIFHCKKRPLNSYTLETPSALPLEERVDAHLAAVRAAITVLCGESPLQG